MAVPSSHVRTRTEPRITANELARFMTTPDTGRMGIIRRARESGTATRVRYSDVRRSLRGHLADPFRNPRSLHAARENFEQRKDDGSLSPFAREDARLSIDVLDSFGRMANALGGYDFKPSPAKIEPLMISGVEVPVNLDALIVMAGESGDRIGGALCRFNKAEDETENAAARRKEIGTYAATLVLMQVQSIAGQSGTTDHSLCLSIDVQCEDVHVAPRAYQKRIKDIENACKFIAAVWATA